MQPDSSAPPDAIVVLGCRVTGATGGTLHRRAEAAARAYHELRPERVIASGGRRWDGVAEATALRDCMVAQGVPRSVVMRELWSLTTVENAIYTGELLRMASLRSVLVVTSDWHVERALACFGACGIAATARAAPTPFGGSFARYKRRLGERLRTRVDLASLPLWYST